MSTRISYSNENWTGITQSRVLISILLLCCCAPGRLRQGVASVPPTVGSLRALPSALGEEAPDPHRHALLIGINHYEQGHLPHRFINLHGVQDAEAMETALHHRGFPPENIRLLRDHQATRQGILRAMDALGARIAPGDMVVLFFSGHGDTMTDEDGDEPDGVDEALVPFDYQRDQTTGGGLLIDDELSVRLNLLNAKASAAPEGRVLFLIDSCFSGVAQRGADDGLSRRGPQTPHLERAGATNQSASSHRGAQRWGREQQPTMIVISAAASNERAYEVSAPDGRPMGALTLALVEMLKSLPAGTTYRSFFEQTRFRVSQLAEQTAQAEMSPESQALRLFGHEQQDSASYFSIPSMHSVVGREIRLPIGMLHGVTEQSVYSVHRAGSGPLGPEIVRGKIAQVRLLDSTLLLEQHVEEKLLVAARLREQVHEFVGQQFALRIWLSGLTDIVDFESLLFSSKPGWVLVRGDASEFDYKITRKHERLVVLSSGGHELLNIEGNPHRNPVLRTSVLQALVRAARLRLLRQIRPLPESALSVSLRVIRADAPSVPIEGKELHLRHNERVFVEVASAPEIPFPLYVSLLEVRKDGASEWLLPTQEFSLGEGEMIPANANGRWIRVGPAGRALSVRAGKDAQWILFATETPSNLGTIDLQNERGAATGGPKTRLGSLLRWFSSGSRSPGDTVLVSERWGVTELILQVSNP